jgi:hypothetical protein
MLLLAFDHLTIPAHATSAWPPKKTVLLLRQSSCHNTKTGVQIACDGTAERWWSQDVMKVFYAGFYILESQVLMTNILCIMHLVIRNCNPGDKRKHLRACEMGEKKIVINAV